MKRISFLLIIGLLCFGTGAALLVNNVVVAQEQPRSVLHPTFPLLDSDGSNVLDSGNPVSTLQTCGSCHDTTFIAAHSVHADLGYSAAQAAGDEWSWLNGTGWYGGWNPITYLNASTTSIEEWEAALGWRHVGGGPAAELGIEMNCFTCHLADPDNSSRVASLESENFEWANTATLNNTGIVTTDGAEYGYNAAAFDTEGNLLPEYVTVGVPPDDNCGACHGIVHSNAQIPLEANVLDETQWHTLTTGQVFSPERISNSGLNIENKAELARSWDIHAERVVNCTDCHYALNNPIFYVEPETSRPDHLEFDPRRMDFGDYLLRPLHQFANGGTEYAEDFPVFERAERDCATCHDAKSSHEWLEYTDRHLEALACESCHVPEIYAPALAAVDWTVLTSESEPRKEYRGVDATVEPVYISGYQPVLLPDRDEKLAPYNIISAWYWVAGDPAKPVSIEDLQAVYLAGDMYAVEIMAAFDADSDGSLTDAELIIDTDEKETLIAGRLSDLGLVNPRIVAEAESYGIYHNVTHGAWATNECSTCHTEDSRLNQSFLLTSNTPGGIQPTLISENLNGDLQSTASGTLQFTASLEVGENGLYILGHHNVALVDIAGNLIFLGSTLGVMIHAGLRYLAARRMPTPHDPALREVYMYSIYERQWHWLQTVAIFGLLFTGMIIHKPDLFGMFHFRGVVLVHNALALILVINAALAAFYHLVSGEIQQFLPRPQGFFGQMFAQARYYAYGIFRGEPHPFEKTRNKKMNPIQQVTYFGLLNVLLPLQVITGTLMWGAQRFPDIADLVGGLPLLGPVHTLVSWLLATFIVVHVYMTTTGHTPLANIRAMIFGWDEVETHAPATGD